MPKIEYLDIDDIRFDAATQPRAAIDESTVGEYAEKLAESDPHAAPIFREVIVFFDGTTYWLADGYHRVLAHKRAGRAKINTYIFKGAKRDAILYAVGANDDHGLRRNNADKRKAVTTLLSDPEWAEWSDMEVARRCRVSPPLVATVRREVAPSTQSSLGAPKRKTSDGRTMNTTTLGRKPEPPATPIFNMPRVTTNGYHEPATASVAVMEPPAHEPTGDEPCPHCRGSGKARDCD